MDPFVIAIPVYDGVDLLDMATPRELFHWAGQADGVREAYDVRVACVADAATVRTIDGLRFAPDHGFDDPAVAAPDVLWIPGGTSPALKRLLDTPDAPFFRYVRRVAPGARVACSVCEGAVLFASTGLLDGYRATTYWRYYPCMADYPAVDLVPPTPTAEGYEYPRYVRDRDRLTGGGVSSGLDEGLFLIGELFGEEVAVSVAEVVQYAPDPPVAPRLTISTECPI